MNEAIEQKADGLLWLHMVKLGRAGDSTYTELANRPLVKTLEAMTGTIMVPLPNNFTPPHRTPWGGRRILKDIKTDVGVTPEFNIVGESWEISSHRSFPNCFELNYAGQNIKVPITIFDRIFSEEIYGKKAVQLHGDGLPFLVKIVNSGSWRQYDNELRELFAWLDTTDYAMTWRKSLNANCTFTGMLAWNHHDLHRALLRLKTLFLQRVLTTSDRNPNAAIWRQSLNVTSIENLRNRPVNELIASLRFLATMQQAGGFSKEAVETENLVRLFELHQKMLEKNLSVQVHPPKGYRGMKAGEHSKSEAWIILNAEPGAGIYLGLKEGVRREQFEAALRAGEDVTHQLNFIPVKAGEAFFIPAGTMHAIGAGVMLLEPQETSETTFRVYDYGRIVKGRPRDLNVDGAMAVTDWDGKRGEDAVQWYRRTPEVMRSLGANSAKIERLLDENVFETQRITFARGQEYRADTMKSVKTYTVANGAVEVYNGDGDAPIGVYRRGQSFMIPATFGEYRMVGLADDSTLFLTTVFTPFGVATSKTTSSVSAIIAGQPSEIQERNEAFIKRPSRGHVLMLNPQGYAGPNPPLSAPDTGGQVEYVNYKARELARMGYKVTVAARSFKPEDKYLQFGDRLGVVFMPGTGDMVRYVFIPGLQERDDAPFLLKEETQFYNDLPTMARHLSLFISEEAMRLGVDAWEYYTYLDSHYVDGGIVGQRLVRVWDHMFVNKYLRERFGEILKDQKDPDPFENDNILNNIPFYFGMRVLTAWYTAIGERPRAGEKLDIDRILKWAVDKLGWSEERKKRLLANAVNPNTGSGRDLAPENYDARAIGYCLLEASGELHRLGRMMKNLNTNVWTVHSLGQLKEDRVLADGVHERSAQVFRELNFERRIAAERELLMGSTAAEFSGELFTGMPPARAVIFTSPEIAQTAFRQGISNTKVAIQFVPGTDPVMYHQRLSINDDDVRHFFLDARARGVMPDDVVSTILSRPNDFNVIVEAGRMDRSKRKHLLIEAMTRLPDNTIMLITGERDEKGVYDDMAARIEKLELQKRVFLLGRVSPELMGPLLSLPHGENADQFRLAVVASASGMEGWGMAVENGSRGGMPLVASDRVPFAIHLKDRKEAAIVVRSGGGDAAEIERYVESLSSLLSNPPLAREMASKALPIVQEYEWRVLTENATAQVMGLLAQTHEPLIPIIAGGSLAAGSRHVVIIAGGSGVRFQPYSTPERPKQFLPITHQERTMLQVTADRFKGVVPSENLWVATNAKHIDLVGEQIPEISGSNIIGEPIKKNTAPAIASIMYWISRHDPDAVVAIVPADHFILNPERFTAQLEEAFEYAAVSGGLVTFGIPPTWSSPEYGYIQFGGTDPVYPRFHRVMSFKEKPNSETARRYLDSGNYLWNSGMFVWSAGSFLQNLALHQKVMFAGLEAVYGKNPMQMTLTPEMMFPYFAALQDISIDYALLEPAAQDNRVFVLPFGTEWSDVGTWESLDRLVKEGRVQPPEEVLEHIRRELVSRQPK